MKPIISCASLSRGAPARRAWLKPSPAALNYGDCFTYALAARTQLTCSVSARFARTDLQVIPI